MQVDLSKSFDDQPLGFGKYAKLTPKQVLDRDPNYIVWMFKSMSEPKCTEALYEEALEAVEDCSVGREPVRGDQQRRSWQKDDPDDDVVSRMERLNNRR